MYLVLVTINVHPKRGFMMELGWIVCGHTYAVTVAIELYCIVHTESGRYVFRLID